MKIYPNIDMEQTGKRLKTLITNAGYDVKYIQKYLHLSCPQPVYRWFGGKVLPSVDHLYSLSKLLGVHMEELLVPKERVLFDVDWLVEIWESRGEGKRHLLRYFEVLGEVA